MRVRDCGNYQIKDLASHDPLLSLYIIAMETQTDGLAQTHYFPDEGRIYFLRGPDSGVNATIGPKTERPSRYQIIPIGRDTPNWHQAARRVRRLSHPITTVCLLLCACRLWDCRRLGSSRTFSDLIRVKNAALLFRRTMEVLPSEEVCVCGRRRP